jgi:hypothetical protein
VQQGVIIVECVKRLGSVEPAVLADLAQRLEAGDHVVPQTDAEKTCFDILKDLDHVGGHVQGSMTPKKYMRNEVWSLIAFKGAPSWFITFSPVDNNHPLCLYFADEKIYFTPRLGIPTRESDSSLVTRLQLRVFSTI